MPKNKSDRVLRIADLFSGAGGASTGIAAACRRNGVRYELAAVNHWPVAIASHKLNHPEAVHKCADLESISPREVVPSGDLDILWASPECIFHSKARGGKPVDDQRRVSAWCVARWAETLHPKTIMVENVEEFAAWGPLRADMRPDKRRAGETFKAWCNSIASMGYTLDSRVLCGADYGAPTSRRRLFVQAWRGKTPVTWPAPTRSENGENGLAKWRAVRECIDWNDVGPSIFTRKRPLCQNTLKRIFRGLVKFGLQDYIVAWDNASAASSEWPITRPLRTVTTKARHGVVSPLLVELRGTSEWHLRNSAKSVDAPLATVTAGGIHAGLLTPFLIPQHSGGAPRSVEKPSPTVCAAGAIGVVTPMLVKYYGSGVCASVDEPLDTVTAKARFGLVMPIVEKDGQLYRLDLRFRMLQPAELSAATGFPEEYKFTGTKADHVTQIGNAVPPAFSETLTANALPFILGERRD